MLQIVTRPFQQGEGPRRGFLRALWNLRRYADSSNIDPCLECEAGRGPELAEVAGQDGVGGGVAVAVQVPAPGRRQRHAVVLVLLHTRQLVRLDLREARGVPHLAT